MRPQVSDASDHLTAASPASRDRNVTQAAIPSGYSAKSAARLGTRLSTNVQIRFAIDAKLAEYERTAGIERVALLDVAKKPVFANIRQTFDGNR